jgi:phosphonate dehydrogenase
VGIVGAGKVGQAVAQRLAGFDATLLYADGERLPPADETRLRLTHTPFEALMANSDFIVMAVPLLADTYQMIRRETLALCKPTALLINPCRGSVVDENAVADALWADRLAGYAADVFAFEDWALPDRPLEVPETLRALIDKTLFTPHLGSAVVQARMAIEMSAAESALAALRGETPPGAINSF